MGKTDWMKRTQVEYVTLKKKGESISGIYLGSSAGEFGLSYKFRTANGLKSLNGNRAILDALFGEFESDDDAFSGGMVGHSITVERLVDLPKRPNRKFAAGDYRLGHNEDCAKCTG